MTDINMEESLKAAISLHLADDEMLSLLEELDKIPDRIGYLQSVFSRLNGKKQPESHQLENAMAKHGLSVEEEFVKDQTQDDAGQWQTNLRSRGYVIVRQLRDTRMKAGKTLGFIPEHHGVATPFKSYGEAMVAAMLYADVLETQSAQFRQPVTQIVLRIPVVLGLEKPKEGMRVGSPLEIDQTHAIQSVYQGLANANIERANGRRVNTHADAFRWLLDTISKKLAELRAN